MTNGPFRYDQVGSLLRTNTLKEAKKNLENESISFEDYKKIEREEIKKSLKNKKKSA